MPIPRTLCGDIYFHKLWRKYLYHCCDDHSVFKFGYGMFRFTVYHKNPEKCIIMI